MSPHKMAPQQMEYFSSPNDAKKWFVAFTSYRGRNPLYRSILPKGFGHVFAFTHFGGCVLMMDPQEGGIVLRKISLPEGRRYGPHLSVFVLSLNQHLQDLTLLEIPYKRPVLKKHPVMVVPNCVTAIKNILCRQSWALTPKGLYQTLLQEGALVVDAAHLNTLYEADVADKTTNIK